MIFGTLMIGKVTQIHVANLAMPVEHVLAH